MLIPHSSGGWKPRIEVLAVLVSGEASLPALQTAAFLLCLLLAEKGLSGVPYREGHSQDFVQPNHPQRPPPPSSFHWGLGREHVNFGGHNLVRSRGEDPASVVACGSLGL